MASIKKIHEDLASKKISVSELAESCLKTIKERDGDIHAFLDVYSEDVLHDAARMDAKIAKSEVLGILEGIPLGVKDNVLVKGKRATAGSKILDKYIASYDAYVVKKLKDAGMLIMGKTNMDEFGMGSSTENSSYGPTKNPHDTSRVPGGSSGGSAAAVASEMVPVAIGTDTGGSIRQPAAFCGTVGFKPSYGRLSRSGLIALASSLDVPGTLSSNVEDAEILFRAMEGDDPLDMTNLEAKEADPEKKEYIVGVAEEFMGEGLDEQVKGVIEVALKKAGNAGFKIETVSLPHASYGLPAYYVIMPAEASSNLARYDGMRYGGREPGKVLTEIYKKTRAEGFGAEPKRRMLIGTYVLSHGYYDAYYVTAQKMRTLISKEFGDVFKKVDFVVAPTTPTPPFKLGENAHDPLKMYLQDIYTVLANIAGIPAISIPAGSVDGLPVGIQLFGERFKDYKLLAAAKKCEEALA
jgi:aspartyl-tRNA(Asn)/glutamyl-tRNA(Gln) amidotransferase subunit A